MANFDISIVDNASWSLTVNWQTAAGVPIDLSAHTAIMTIRSHATSSTTLLQLSSAAGEITINGPLGKMVVTITAAQAATLTQSRGVYDLVITDTGTAQVDQVLAGTVTIVNGVT